MDEKSGQGLPEAAALAENVEGEHADKQDERDADRSGSPEEKFGRFHGSIMPRIGHEESFGFASSSREERFPSC
jgi:hypothetical protein